MTDHCSQQAPGSSVSQSPPRTRKRRPPHGCHNRLPSKTTQCHICNNSPGPGKPVSSGARLYTWPASKWASEQSTSPLAATLHTADLKTFLQRLQQTEEGTSGGRMQARPVPFLLECVRKENAVARLAHAAFSHADLSIRSKIYHNLQTGLMLSCQSRLRQP